ncbi:hypothetical protein KBC86_04720 [Candidatus Gracilibacteria bacterium]|nr:hypothetical protein [Candidatus Gracilibacteria bacterium]
MASSFEKFTSDVQEDVKVGEDTRVKELRMAWMEEHPGEPYPESNGVGESVGPRDQLQDKGDKKTDEQKRKEGEEQAREALRISQEHAHVEASTRVPGFPPEALMAWGVPDASEVASTGAASVAEGASESPA